MSPPDKAAFDWFAGVLGAVLFIIAISPFLNWLGGNGFTWYF